MKKLRWMWAGWRFDLRGMLRVAPLSYALFVGFFMVVININTFENQPRICKQWLETFGGFEYQEFLNLDYIAKWVLLLLPWFFSTSLHMENEFSGGCQTSLYRFPKYHSWYFSKVLSSTFTCVVIMTAVFVGLVLGSWFYGITQWDIRIVDASGFSRDGLPLCFMASGLLLCHVVMLTQWQMLWHLVSGNAGVAAIAFLLLPMVGVHNSSNIEQSLAPLSSPANWGMLFRSDILSNPGFSFENAIISQLLSAVACAIIGMVACKYCHVALRVVDER